MKKEIGMINKPKMLGLSTLIDQIKQDLLSQPVNVEEALFQVDEVTVELNFVVSGDVESGFNFGVVSLGSNVDESRVQKITVKLMPLVKYEPVTIPAQATQSASVPDGEKVKLTTGRDLLKITGLPPIVKNTPGPIINRRPPIVKAHADKKLAALKIKNKP